MRQKYLTAGISLVLCAILKAQAIFTLYVVLPKYLAQNFRHPLAKQFEKQFDIFCDHIKPRNIQKRPFEVAYNHHGFLYPYVYKQYM